MKKIALISHAATLNGGPISLAELYGGLTAGDFPAEVHFGLPAPGPLLERCRFAPERLFFYGRGRMGRKLSPAGGRIRRSLRRHFRDRGIGGVTANTLESFPAVLAAAESGLPSLWMIREMADSYLKRKELPEIREAARAADLLLFNSRTSREQLSLLGGELERKAAFVHNGVRIPEDSELAADYRSQLGFNPGDLILGSVGDVAPSKGYDTLLRAFASVNRLFPAARLAIVGRQPRRFERYFRDLKRLGKSLGVSDRLIFAGEQEKIHPWFCCFDMLVHPSRKESFGRAVVEALARAKPVVATRSGGVEEIDGGEGVISLVAVDDSDGLAGAICRLIEDPEERARLGRRGRRWAAEKYSFAASLRSIGEKMAGVFAL